MRKLILFPICLVIYGLKHFYDFYKWTSNNDIIYTLNHNHYYAALKVLKPIDNIRIDLLAKYKMDKIIEEISTLKYESLYKKNKVFESDMTDHLNISELFYLFAAEYHTYHNIQDSEIFKVEPFNELSSKFKKNKYDTNDYNECLELLGRAYYLHHTNKPGAKTILDNVMIIYTIPKKTYNKFLKNKIEFYQNDIIYKKELLYKKIYNSDIII